MVPIDDTALLSALDEYRTARSQAAFATIYDATAKLRKSNDYQVCRSRLGDSNDALALFDDVLLNVLKAAHVTTGFIPYLCKSLRNERMSFFNAKTKHRSRHVSADDDVLIDHTTPEGLYLAAEQKKRASTLVNALLTDPSSGVSPQMIAVIADLPKYRTVNQLAIANGIHHTSVLRSLTKLSRRFNANCFGDIRDII